MGQGNCAANREVYCRQCYCRVEGLQGYGWSGGSGSVPPLTTTQCLTSQEEPEARLISSEITLDLEIQIEVEEPKNDGTLT